MINYFQEEMPPPIVGMGQSWGGYPIMQTALFHPRLFTAVVALEPFLSIGGAPVTMQGTTALLMAKRRDRWSSREAARQALLKTPYYAAFDSDVFDRVMRYDLRDVPTETVPGQSQNSEHPPVTLTTPKAMEVATMIRPNPANHDDPTSEFDPNVDQSMIPGFHRVEPSLIQRRLGFIRPQTLYVFATESIVDKSGSYLEFLMQNTGTGRGGNGGRAKGAVASAIVKGATPSWAPLRNGHSTDSRYRFGPSNAIGKAEADC
jgi:pimeloyl-ACP methyl ester carboxylesterase